MKQLQTESTTQPMCTVCRGPLKWWNAQKCVDCGHTVCSQHACVLKHSTSSSVLYTYCNHCAQQHLVVTGQPISKHINS